MGYEFRNDDLALLMTLLGPNHVLARAEEYGEGCLVSGAPEAYAEVRSQIRQYIQFVRWRDEVTTHDLQIANSLRAVGWIPYSYEHVTPLEPSVWRDTAEVFWGKSPGLIPGEVQVEVGNSTQDQVDLASILLMSEALAKYSETNRAILQGKTWQRHSSEVMVHRNLRGNIKSIVLNPVGKDLKWVKGKLSKGLRKLLEDEKKPTQLSAMAPQLMQAWARAGFITSAAGAMISLVGKAGVERGQSALVPCNGIPIAVTVGKVLDGKVWIGLNIDHRAIDGDDAGKLYQYLKAHLLEATKGN